MKTEPQKEHALLQTLIGDWTYEAQCTMGPGQPSQTSRGTESVRSLGGLWVVGEGQGEMPDGGGPATMIITLGYDPNRKRFVGTWVGSMMAHLWVYDGSLDSSGRVLTLDAEGPSGADGKMAKFQDIIEFQGDRRVLRSRMQGEDGTWSDIMTAHYRRK